MTQAIGHALLACDAVARDPNGKTTLYGIFDRIWAVQFPAIHPTFSIYWRCFVPGPGRVDVAILRPDGSTLAELEPIETNKEVPHTLQGTYTLAGFEFPSDGEYVWVLRYNRVDILRSPMHLQKRGSI